MTEYSGGSYFWGIIEDILDGTTLTHDVLYKKGLRRVQDSLNACRDFVNSLRTELGQTHTVEPAVAYSVGPMGDLLFYDPIDTPVGDLDGKTLILMTDLAGPVTITFATPGNPAAACALINSQGSSLGIIADVDDGVDPITGVFTSGNIGRLRIKRYGAGTPSITIDKDGTANSAFGFSTGSDTTVTGTAGTALDGASRIGLSEIAAVTWAGGTLRDFLETNLIPLVGSIGFDVSTKVNKAGDTMTGLLTITQSGTGEAVSATGGSSSGRAAYFKGGAPNGQGGDFEGAGSGYGGGFLGGATGFGVIGKAGGGNQPGVKAWGDGTGPDLECVAGPILFSGAQPSASSDPGENRAHATNIPKSWAYITTDGAGNATCSDGLSVASVAVTATRVQITFAHAFANANYSVTVTNGTPQNRVCAVDDTSKTTTFCEVAVFNANTGAIVDPSAIAIKINVHVDGRH